MNFLVDYLMAIDVLAILACVALVIAAFVRRENIWLGILAVVVIIWAAARLPGLI
ncbi:hypothetical protein [Hyphomicrobium sp.]|uniref:hypothetical protein n=1 Tax=Hyphomicrobium sp. TaxID=82 RepID=UPI002D79D8BF|nr:hypothetical protein [Hyphomicrobium sp.]HET6390402.1 hypothetical protein [Hyphomicrobium sp.]